MDSTFVGGALVGGTALFLLASYMFMRSDSDWVLKFKGDPPADAFKGKVVWITGASQGLGEALALHFARLGARLILSSRRPAELDRVEALCAAAAGASSSSSSFEALTLPLDVTGPYEELVAAAAKADDAFGSAGVDYIIHNAGASQHSPVEATSAEVELQMLRLNVLGPICLTKALLPHMLRRERGHVVAICSMSAKIPSPGQATYAACKSALFGYMGSLASELADRGVAVTLACPGPIATGTDDHPRQVFGPGGLLTKAQPTGLSKSRVPPPRVAALIARAAYHKLPEVWIAKNPVLALGHVMQFLPSLGWRIMKKIGPSRVRDIKGGGSGYDVKKLLFGGGGGQPKKAA